MLDDKNSPLNKILDGRYTIEQRFGGYDVSEEKRKYFFIIANPDSTYIISSANLYNTEAKAKHEAEMFIKNVRDYVNGYLELYLPR